MKVKKHFYLNRFNVSLLLLIYIILQLTYKIIQLIYKIYIYILLVVIIGNYYCNYPQPLNRGKE